MLLTQLQKLIEESDDIFDGLDSMDIIDSVMLKNKYEDWVQRVIDVIGNEKKINSTNPFRTYKSHMWPEVTPSDNLIVQQTNPYKYGHSITYVRKRKEANQHKEFKNIFENQINFLIKMENEEAERIKAENVKATSIFIDSDGLITANEKSFKYDPDSKMFKTIKYLAKHKEYISGNVLLKNSKYYDMATLVDAINKINATFLDELSIEELITHPGHKSGYKINSKYKIEFK